MPIDIGPGISIGPGITISSAAATNSLRDALSAAGKTAYDAATVNNFFGVSAADYGNVVAQLSSVTKYAMNDTALANTGGGGWTANFAQALPTATATVPAGTYIIGFASRTLNANGTATPLIGTTFPPTGSSYTAIANSPSITTGAVAYYIRKAPTTATATTSYVGIVLSVTATLCASAVYTGTGFYSTSGPPFTSWTSWNTTFINYQVLGTPTLQW